MALKLLAAILVAACAWVYLSKNTDLFKEASKTPDEIARDVSALKPNAESARRGQIYQRGERFIHNSLKAPATSGFSSMLSDPHGTGAQPRVDGTWEAFGSVDTQSSLGTKLRQQWVVIFAEDGTTVLAASLGAQELGDTPVHAVAAMSRSELDALRRSATPKPAPKQGDWMFKNYRRALDPPAQRNRMFGRE